MQIFATDIDVASIEKARVGVYPDSIAADVSSERLERFFIKEESSYRISKSIRDMVVFAKQDVLKDPPFSRLDLISCRNLLIYLSGEAQKKILPLFHYALNQDGHLFLGNSETIGEFTDLFAVVDKKWKIYQQAGEASSRHVAPAPTCRPWRQRFRSGGPVPCASRRTRPRSATWRNRRCWKGISRRACSSTPSSKCCTSMAAPANTWNRRRGMPA